MRDDVVTFQTEMTEIAQLQQALGQALPASGLVCVLIFVSPEGYDLDALGLALYELYGDRAVGCTSAGQFGPAGYQLEGVMAMAFYGDWYMRPCLVPTLREHNGQFQGLVDDVEACLDEMPDDMSPFGLVLIDGLSMQEERFMAHLYKSLTQMPVVGGSAGDALLFRLTSVLFGGRFVSDAAIVLVCGTTRPLSVIQAQHHVPTEQKLVVTEAEPERRRVLEINGYPAVKAYCAAINISEGQLGPTVFSQYPLTLTLGQDHYIRSIQSSHEDGSLSFYCAVEEGIILSLANPISPVQVIEDAFQRASEELGQAPSFVLGFDCILRRLEYEACELQAVMEASFIKGKVAGFFTYGEQIDGLHVNQTFTGIAFGEQDR